jgi:hypothetical protein
MRLDGVAINVPIQQTFVDSVAEDGSIKTSVSTIFDIKIKLEEIMGVVAGSIVLYPCPQSFSENEVDHHEDWFEDHQTIDECGIVDKQTLLMIVDADRYYWQEHRRLATKFKDRVTKVYQAMSRCVEGQAAAGMGAGAGNHHDNYHRHHHDNQHNNNNINNQAGAARPLNPGSQTSAAAAAPAATPASAAALVAAPNPAANANANLNLPPRARFGRFTQNCRKAMLVLGESPTTHRPRPLEDLHRLVLYFDEIVMPIFQIVVKREHEAVVRRMELAAAMQ